MSGPVFYLFVFLTRASLNHKASLAKLAKDAKETLSQNIFWFKTKEANRGFGVVGSCEHMRVTSGTERVR